jgi:thiamine biosynthesis lipoprotein
VVAGNTVAVATSGTAERGAHIADPHLGSTEPGADAPTSVTIVGTQLATVDAYATAAFAMGMARAREWIASLSGYQALIIAADGSRWKTPGFGAR